ncbi:multiple epidermal growth factor-like domains protein 9 [Discoglossus pictus]
MRYLRLSSTTWKQVAKDKGYREAADRQSNASWIGLRKRFVIGCDTFQSNTGDLIGIVRTGCVGCQSRTGAGLLCEVENCRSLAVSSRDAVRGAGCVQGRPGALSRSMEARATLALFLAVVAVLGRGGWGLNSTEPGPGASTARPEERVQQPSTVNIPTLAPSTPSPGPEPSEVPITPTPGPPKELTPSIPGPTPTPGPGIVPSPTPVVIESTPGPTPGREPTAAPTDTTTPAGTSKPTEGVPCNCTSVGSINPPRCNASGACTCHPGYSGLHCEDCFLGFYRNVTSGLCLACNCSNGGASDITCDSTGHCKCKTGATGQKCDKCESGFFRQPEGVCTECQDNTTGYQCEDCKPGFYKKGVKCSRCPCSPVRSNGTCHLDKDDVACDRCKPTYTGRQCEKCDKGYYTQDAICIVCNCSGNVDPVKTPEICNPDTGVCLKCLNNTQGVNCEKCLDGYNKGPTGKCIKIEVTTTRATERPTTINATSAVTTVQTLASSSTSASTTVHAVSTTSSSDNSTSSLADVSWTQFNIIILTVIIIVVVLLMGFVGAVYMYREYQSRKLNAPFWTIELKEDNISFSSYHDSIPNADVSGLLEDDASEMAPNGQLSLTTPIHHYKA